MTSNQIFPEEILTETENISNVLSINQVIEVQNNSRFLIDQRFIELETKLNNLEDILKKQVNKK